MSNIDIKKLSWTTGVNSRLEFNITNVDNTIVNCIRRMALSKIPIYVFKDIKISTNTSIFNNNYMKLRLSNLPVLGIVSDEMIYTKKIVEPLDKIDENDEMDDIDMSTNENVNVNSSSLKQLTMYLDKTNNTSEIINVGTDDCQFYYMEKLIDSPYKMPYCGNIPIIKLQPTQQIKLSAITGLGIEDESSIYAAVSIFSYRMIDMKSEISSYDISLESRGQLDEKMILKYSIHNIIHLLVQFIKLMPSNNDISGKILVNDADHTIGTLISSGLQNHKLVKFAGYNMPHLLDNKILFHYELYKADNIKDILNDVVDKYIKIFTSIDKMVEKKITL
jgi:DNA-directed RNA polymerase subunit L/DNA-directed RNA polymerase alpha subunit